MASLLGQGQAQQLGGEGPGMTPAPGGGYQPSGGGGQDLLSAFNQGGDKVKGTKASNDTSDDLDKLLLSLVAAFPGGQLLSMIGKPKGEK